MAKKPKLERNDVVAGRYRIDRVIGKGGFGAVYEASTVDSSQRVALKVMHQKLTTSAIDQRRFQRESALVQSLQHPNVVRVLDFGETDAGLPFIAFELLQGRALEQVIKAEGAMPWPRVAQISSDVLQALIAAHAIGIVHRDIKPANVFLCEGEGGTIATKVLDFGIAKSLATEAGKATQLTETGQMLGTPYYMAPEQVRGLTIGPTIDLYALGLVMAEMLTGKRAIRGESVIEVYMAQISDAPLKFEREVEQCPLWPTIQRATAKAIDQRFKTATDMNDAVQIALRAAPVDARLAARSIPLGSTIGIDDELSGITGALFLGVGKDEPEPESLVEGRPSRHISSPNYPAAAVGSTTPLGPASVQPERAQSSLLSRERVAQLAQLPSDRSLSDSAETKLYDASAHAPQQGQRQPVNTGPTALYTPGRQATPAPGARPGAQGYAQSQAHPQSQAQPASQAHAHAQAQAQAQAAHLQQNRGMQGQAGNQQPQGGQGGGGGRPGTAGGPGGVSASYVAASRSPYPVAERASDYPARLARGSPIAQSAAAASNAQISPYAQPSGGAAQRPGGSFNPERTLDDVSELTLDDMPPRAPRGSQGDSVPAQGSPAGARGGVRGPAAGTMLMPSKEPEPAPDPLASTMHMDEAMARAYAAQGAQPGVGAGARADAGRASGYGQTPGPAASNANTPGAQHPGQSSSQAQSPAGPDGARAPHYQSGVQPSPLYSSSPPPASPPYASSIQPSPLAAPTSDNPAVASPASPRAPRRGFPIWAILLIVAVLGGGGAALFFVLR